jgi:hypothetical protein
MLLELFEVNSMFEEQINRVLVKLFGLNVVVKVELPS